MKSKHYLFIILMVSNIVLLITLKNNITLRQDVNAFQINNPNIDSLYFTYNLQFPLIEFQKVNINSHDDKIILCYGSQACISCVHQAIENTKEIVQNNLQVQVLNDKYKIHDQVFKTNNKKILLFVENAEYPFSILQINGKTFLLPYESKYSYKYKLLLTKILELNTINKYSS